MNYLVDSLNEVIGSFDYEADPRFLAEHSYKAIQSSLNLPTEQVFFDSETSTIKKKEE